jgi:hypothetical protein
MRIEDPSNYYFVRFEKSTLKNKKYDAVLMNKKTKKEKRVPFGAIKPDGTPYQHYRDRTGLGLYSKYDHNDTERRKRYITRHKKDMGFKYSSGWFAKQCLW